MVPDQKQAAGVHQPVGYWVVAACNTPELMQWGIDGDTVDPYLTRKEAVAQAHYLQEGPQHEDDALYILTVFSTGRIRFDEFDAREELTTCEECGREKKTFMHNCPLSGNYPEIFGCPECDDTCPNCERIGVKDEGEYG